MPSPTCKTPHRREIAPSSAASFFVVGNQEKVQRAVLFPSFVVAGLRHVSMLTCVRRRIGPVREEAPVPHPEGIYLDAVDRNLQHAEDRACWTWRVQAQGSITVAGHSFLDTRFRNVSRLTWSIDPRRPGVQPAEPFLRVEGGSLGWKISSLEHSLFSSKPGSAMSGPDIISRRNELVQDRCAGDNV